MAYEVTIGIPVYNIERYVRLAMDSALAQTFQSIEFLVLDDCGTDSSMDIVREYQQNHPRGKDIRIVRQLKNGGIGNARNRIIDESSGKFLFFMDSDDTLPSNAIELLYSAMKRYDAQIVYGSNERIYNELDAQKVEVESYSDMQFLHGDEFADYAYDSFGNITANVWKYLIDINVYRENHLRFPTINYWEDFVMTVDLPAYITRAVFISDIIYQYHCRAGSLSNYQKRDLIEKQEIQDTIEALEQLKQNSHSLKDRSFFHKRMYKVMLAEFYIVCAIFRNENVISPPFEKREIRDIMSCPLAFSEIMHLRGWRFRNLLLFLLGELPPFFSVATMRVIGRCRKLI